MEDRLESLRRFLPGWEGWDIDPADVGRVSVALSADGPRRGSPVIRSTDGKPLKLTRTGLGVSGTNQFVELVFAHAEQLPPPNVELRVDGNRLEPVTEQHNASSRGKAPSDPKQKAARYGDLGLYAGIFRELGSIRAEWR